MKPIRTFFANLLGLQQMTHTIEELKTGKRSQRGRFGIEGYDVEFADCLSFYYQYKDIFQTRIYHFESRKSSPVIYDLGGCIGLSVLYFKKIFPQALVTCFEPDPELFDLLELNVKRNNLAGVTTINAGLGKDFGVMEMYRDGADGGSMIVHHQGPSISVPVVPLSAYISETVDMLKMNIEGMEGEILEEIEGQLHLVRAIIFEYHCFDDLPQKLGKMLQILDRNGFRYVVTDATSAKVPIPFQMPIGYRYFNLVYAVRTDHRT
jgi:FkbM family methyltransferase